MTETKIPNEMNATQRETVEMLLSRCDDLKIEAISDAGGAYCFEGEGQDGPCVGYIEVNGTVSWIVAG